MPVCEAASTSRTSRDLPSPISMQLWQTLQGSSVGPWMQFNAFARMRAVVVFPVPRMPLNTKACATRPERIAFTSVRVTCSCPTTSAKVCGRARLASTS